MMAPDKARHYAVATALDSPVDPSVGFVFQYEVALTEGLECGGAYTKLLTATDELDVELLDGDTPYTIMFGPDKCGGTNKVRCLCPASPSRGGLPGLAGVTTRPAGFPSGGVPPAVARQLHVLTALRVYLSTLAWPHPPCSALTHRLTPPLAPPGAPHHAPQEP
jgi:hypothetical protein